MGTTRPAFGALLREHRVRAGLAQETLAERAGLSAQTISSLERGARLAPQRATLGLLMDALGLDEPARRAFETAAAASTKARVRSFERVAEAELPVVPTSFVGRDDERSELVRRLLPGRCVTVWGSGGVGKTRLMLEAARDALRRFDGAWFVDLAAIADSADVARAVASATGIRELEGRSLESILTEELAPRSALLLLDNAEHVLAGCARFVSALLSRGTALAIACTSREPLRVNGEDVFALEPLPLPATGDGELSRSAALRLFADRAERAGCPLPAADAAAAAEICRRLDAIPLAIELAAARMPMMSAPQILAGLDDRFRLLTRGARNVARRHQTLQAAFAWSYELASEDERVVLRSIAAWPGRWTLDDAVAVVGDRIDRWSVIDAVAALVDRSLVAVETDAEGAERRYRLLQTTALYALERLRESDDERACRDRAAQHVRAACAVASDAWRGADDRPFRALEIAAVRAALRWTLGDGRTPELAAAIAGDSAMLWEIRGLSREGLEWIARAREALAGRISDGAARCEIGEARLARRLLLSQRSYDAAVRAIDIARALGDERLAAIATLLSVYPLAALDRPGEGRRALREATEIFRRIGDSNGTLSCMLELGFLAVRDGAFEEARESLIRLNGLFEERGNRRALAQTTIDLAEVEYLLGDVRGAVARADSVLDATRALGAWSLFTAALRNLAGYHLTLGEVAQAYARAREALELSIRHDQQVGEALALGHLAEVHARTGRARDAALLLGYVDRQLEELASLREALEERGYERCRTLCERELGRAELASLIDEGAGLNASAARALAESRPSIVRPDSATA